jgi:hypothetical protein
VLHVAVRSVPVDKDKIARARPTSARGEAGLIYADRSAPWFPEFVAECTGFPRRSHDDQVDALAGADLMATEHGGLHAMSEAMKKPSDVRHTMPGTNGSKPKSSIEQMVASMR